MKRNRIVIGVLLCLLVFGVINGYAESIENNEIEVQLNYATIADYMMYMGSSTVGYNVSYATKSPQRNTAIARISYIDLSFPTNHLVTDANGVQCSTNCNIPGYVSACGTMTFYAPNHEGTVILRLNTGSVNTGYTISGRWTPNWKADWPASWFPDYLPQ